MRALSIRQPWAWLILYAGKDVENRNWRTDYRGEILIHAGQRWDDEIQAGRNAIYPDVFDAVLHRYSLDMQIVKGWAHAHGRRKLSDIFKTGGIIGKVEIIDCVQNYPSKWAHEGQWHWVLQNPKPLPFIPYKGRLGFFPVHVPHNKRNGADFGAAATFCG